MATKNILGTLLLSLLFFSCNSYEPVELVSVNHVVLESISPTGANFSIRVTIQNPNDYNITLTSKDVEVFVNEKFIGTANFREPIKLAKKSTQEYNIRITSAVPSDGNIDLGTLATSTLLGVMKIRVKGEIKASAKGISKTVPVDFVETIKL